MRKNQTPLQDGPNRNRRPVSKSYHRIQEVLMTGFNKVMLMGNVTRDPQLKYLPSQTPVAEFGLAVNRRFKTAQGEEREEVVFIEITAFGKQAETIHQYWHKGKPLFVEGRLKFDQWDDKETGQ